MTSPFPTRQSLRPVGPAPVRPVRERLRPESFSPARYSPTPNKPAFKKALSLYAFQFVLASNDYITALPTS